MRNVVGAIILAVGCGTALHADFLDKKATQWHQWRGPNGTGYAPDANPPTKWDENTNIRWKAPLVGRGSATPIVWENQVIVLTAVETDKIADKLPPADPRFQTRTERPNRYYQFIVFSFDRQTGKQLWKTIVAEAVPHEGCHATHSYAAGSPTTDGTRIYACFGSQGIFALDFSGKVLWKQNLGQLHTRLGWGEAVTPVYHKDSLYLNWDQEADSKLYCLDAATGKTRWVVDRDEKSSWNTPLLVNHNETTQVVLNGTTRIRGYHAESGKLIWECPGMTTNAIPSPVADDKWIYVMSGYRGAAAVAIPIDAKGNVAKSQLGWSYDKATPYVPSPLLVNNRLYFSQTTQPVFSSLDTTTGKPVIDRERLPSATSFYASPAASKSHIYYPDRTGTTVVLKLGDQFDVVSVNTLKDELDASPVLLGKTLFLRGHKNLYCIEETSK
ncbi:MAG: PQQ-binding-like beta-propeller repeat protein [Zavarzinella sp.]